MSKTRRASTPVTKKLIEDFPKLNVLINNAGVMHIDNAAGAVDEALLVSTITTNLMGPIRITGGLIEHLKKQDHAAVMNVSSVLGFVPLNNEPRAMPLAEFISETMKVIETGAQEVLVERAKPLRNNVGSNEGAFVTQFNDLMAQPNSQK